MFPNLRTLEKFLIFAGKMIVTFEQTNLQELYVEGKSRDKKHRSQPQVVSKYIRVINLMKQQENMLGLTKYGSLHYEKLHGNKEGRSSVRINDQYRIEFTEALESGKQIATICNITELSNHYE
jgi:proteic killer suppression protein